MKKEAVGAFFVDYQRFIRKYLYICKSSECRQGLYIDSIAYG